MDDEIIREGEAKGGGTESGVIELSCNVDRLIVRVRLFFGSFSSKKPEARKEEEEGYGAMRKKKKEMAKGRRKKPLLKTQKIQKQHANKKATRGSLFLFFSFFTNTHSMMQMSLPQRKKKVV